MAGRPRKVIISCALTGGIHTPTMSAALPVTPDMLAEQGVAAAQAGQGETADVGADVEDDVVLGEAVGQAVLVLDDDVAEDAAVDGARPQPPVPRGVAEDLEPAVALA